MFNEKRGDRKNAPNLMIVMTDGVSTVDASMTCDSARNARYHPDYCEYFMVIQSSTRRVLEPMGWL